ncbi:probable complex I intermediate-associated protein 30, mitochondrial [Galendromus occidentalis]|uniref:Probable complex I intermediate-associated protein 30, mitochondrial n=1 Tax=Galendromus occidentalis TaxID=34638 RepID=A0AAJ6QM69_9ACAR|nr:probable complex I intermediate-associated protein 30, mitochondrial [Galendromus occidentalis]
MSRALRNFVQRNALLPYFYQPKRHCFWNPDPRRDREDPHGNLWHLWNGSKIFVKECERAADEWKEKLHLDRARYHLGEVVPQYLFREQKDRDLFYTITDSDWNQGFSKAEFVGTRQGSGLFRGVLDTRVPRDGVTKRAGIAVLQSFPKTKSFQRKVYLDWGDWTHLVIRCRGDGRHYSINLHMCEEDDLTMHLLYQYPLYTRGGPYWQITRIPFSKFMISYKGSIQDKQNRIDPRYITKIGIALMDKTSGPFELEIDYIACSVSRSDEDEEFAYETYETPNNYSHAYGMK